MQLYTSSSPFPIFRTLGIELKVLVYHFPVGPTSVLLDCRQKQMTCSWCGKSIPFFRSLKDSRYCCDRHEDEERAHLGQLAIQRLGSWQSAPESTPEFPTQEQAAAPGIAEPERELKTA
jgi:hypothetical protein